MFIPANKQSLPQRIAGSAEALSATFEIAAGIGNRHSDVTAYTNADLPWSRIFIKLTEYPDELAVDFDTQKAIRFGSYDELRTAQITKL